MQIPHLLTLTLTLSLAPFTSAFALGLNARTQDLSSIEQVLNRYPIAIDSKDFGRLAEVFTPGAVADYGEGVGVLTGLEEIERRLEASLAPVTTQHALSTQVIDLTSRNAANSTTYFTATHFGANKTEGEVLYAYGQYRDELVKGRGVKGEWRVARRRLVYMGPLIGNLAVFLPS